MNVDLLVIGATAAPNGTQGSSEPPLHYELRSMNFVKIFTHNLIFEYNSPLYILGEYNYQACARLNNFYCFIAHGSYPGLLPPAFQPLTLLGVFVISFVFLHKNVIDIRGNNAISRFASRCCIMNEIICYFAI